MFLESKKKKLRCQKKIVFLTGSRSWSNHDLVIGSWSDHDLDHQIILKKWHFVINLVISWSRSWSDHDPDHDQIMIWIMIWSWSGSRRQVFVTSDRCNLVFILMSSPAHQHVLPPPSHISIRYIRRHSRPSSEYCFVPVQYCGHTGCSYVSGRRRWVTGDVDTSLLLCCVCVFVWSVFSLTFLWPVLIPDTLEQKRSWVGVEQDLFVWRRSTGCFDWNGRCLHVERVEMDFWWGHRHEGRVQTVGLKILYKCPYYKCPYVSRLTIKLFFGYWLIW